MLDDGSEYTTTALGGEASCKQDDLRAPIHSSIRLVQG